jgi:alpha-glucosidase
MMSNVFRWCRDWLGGLILSLGLIAMTGGSAQAAVAKEKFNFSHNGKEAYLLLHLLSDDMLHAEYAMGGGPDADIDLYSSPMVFTQDSAYPGPGSFQRTGNALSTSRMHLVVEDSGCINVKTNQDQAVTSVCPWGLDFVSGRGLSLQKDSIENVYGIGQFFVKWKVGQSDGDWLAHGWFSTESGMGNAFAGFPADDSGAWGANSQVQFPIMYAITPATSLGVFFDNVYKQEWNFNGPWIEVRNTPSDGNGAAAVSDPALRFYLMLGDSLLDVRKDYMNLVGTPPVPPRKAFGLWLSEFGFDNWGEIDWKLTGDKDGKPGLRAAGFPIDGFVLDLQWYGSVIRDSPDTRMGSLEWDPNRFPDPDARLAQYHNDNIDFIAIEQSYVGKNRWAYTQLRRRGLDDESNSKGAGYLIHLCDTDTPIEFTDWFGQVGMIDWSELGAGDWVHTWKRKPNLIDKGVTGHWTDLGEPEKYYTNACYNNAEADRFRHTDIHNIYNFLWHKSIYEGYVKDHVSRRPFLLARAGAPGIQRFGAAMWSGDITSRLEALANHWNAQMHMSFAGIDYYGSDVGGFWRQSVWGDRAVEPGRLPNIDDLYSQWYADSAWTDVPLRPHAYNCGFDPRFLSYPGCPSEGAQAYETSPAWIGSPPHIESHRFATQQRYGLIPYYYSLAHAAYDSGTPVVAPPVMYFQDDPNLRQMGHQKMIGKDILVALVAKHGQYLRNVYLPAGRWINYHSGEWIDSTGQWTGDIDIWSTGKLVLPVFVRAGAILPLMAVDNQTKDAFGHRQDGSVNTDLILKVYPDAMASQFTLWEDDGTSVLAYDATTKRPSYRRRSTLLTQQLDPSNQLTITIAAVDGSLDVGPIDRNNDLRLFTNGLDATAVSLNGTALAQAASPEALTAQDSGWINLANGQVRIKTGTSSVSEPKRLVVDLSAAQCEADCSQDIRRTIVFLKKQTSPGEDMFLRGGLDHEQAAASGIDCTADNKLCAIPISHRILTSDPNRQNDNYLDWYGAEPGQINTAGSPLVWTTDVWPQEWGAKKTVAQDGYGETPLNSFGLHYWMLDVGMDCSRTANGWFELKAFLVTNGVESWEGDIAQSSPGQPYVSSNHFGVCGKMNVFEFGLSSATVQDIP